MSMSAPTGPVNLSSPLLSASAPHGAGPIEIDLSVEHILYVDNIHGFK